MTLNPTINRTRARLRSGLNHPIGAFAAALTAGAVGALGFAPLNLWPLTIGALVVFLLLVARAHTWARAAAVGWGFGFGLDIVSLNWIAGAFRYQEAMPVWFGWLGVALLSLYFALFPALAALTGWFARPRPPQESDRSSPAPDIGFALAAAGGWIVTEWLRATLLTGFGWNPLGIILVTTPGDGWARVVGSYGLGGLVMLVAATFWTRARLIAAPLACALVWAGGWALTPGVSRGTRLAVVVQPNVDQALKNGLMHDEAILNRTMALTDYPLPGDPPRLIFWPEAASPFPLNMDGVARRAIARHLGPRDLIFAGSDRIVPRNGGSFDAANSVFMIDARGRIRDVYDKAHLVPFGEYLPMPALLKALGLARLVPGDGSFLRGPGARTLALPDEPVSNSGGAGLLLCYEVIFSGETVDRTRRPDFLFNPSNDAWFGEWGPPQHFAQARLRAIEEGLPVVRATPTGVSGVIAPDGSVVAALPRHRPGVIKTEIPAPAAPGPFARFGNALPLLLALAMLGAGFALKRGTKKG